jgi:fucose 4-O-acetylase-like acetyltransferase
LTGSLRFTGFPGFAFFRLCFLSLLLFLLLEPFLFFLSLLLCNATGFFLLPLSFSFFLATLLFGPAFFVQLLLIDRLYHRARFRLLLGNQPGRYAPGWRLVIGAGPRPTRKRNAQNQQVQRDRERHR